MQIVITLIILAVMLALLIREAFDPLLIFGTAVAVFLVLGYLTLDEAVSGFANKGVLTVAVLYVLAGAVERSAAFVRLTRFDHLSEQNFKTPELFLSVLSLSAFSNNTPIVSVFTTITQRIASKVNVPASKFLMPISYLSVLGGLLTLIGTSSNLIISGLMESYGMTPLGFFELTQLSGPVALAGFLYILLFHQMLLPSLDQAADNDVRQSPYVVRFVVPAHSKLIGKPVAALALDSYGALTLQAVIRGGQHCDVTDAALALQAGDNLLICGLPNDIDQLRAVDDVLLETEHKIHSNYFTRDQTTLLEVVVTQKLTQQKLSIKDLRFKGRYNAVVIGLIRRGQATTEPVEQLILKRGDTLLVIAQTATLRLIEHDPALIIVNRRARAAATITLRDYLPLVAVVGAIATAVALGLPILLTATIAVITLLLVGSLTINQALAMVDTKTVVLIAISFAIGKVIINTQTASYLARLLLPAIQTAHPLIILLICSVIGAALTSIITNNAAAVLAVPIVYELTQLTAYDARPFIMVTAIAVCAAFLSPFGYQTNTMVYGVAGYRFSDFIRFGTPLLVIVMLVSSFSAYLLFF